jgi:hypothetical protein
MHARADQQGGRQDENAEDGCTQGPFWAAPRTGCDLGRNGDDAAGGWKELSAASGEGMISRHPVVLSTDAFLRGAVEACAPRIARFTAPRSAHRR